MVMKNKTALLIICIAIGQCVKSQDTLFLKNNSMMPVKVISITSSMINFIKADNMKGPAFLLPIEKVAVIKYENGTIDSLITAYDFKTIPSAPEKGIKFWGPRIGCTLIGDGTAADKITEKGKTPFVTQFGWQFETRIFTAKNGFSGLVEIVPLIGGFEQGMFLPSGSALFGVRTQKGLELALGPNLSLTGLGMVFAVGTSFHIDDIYFPVNLCVVPSVNNKTNEWNTATGKYEAVTTRTGIRISLLIGFNIRKS